MFTVPVKDTDSILDIHLLYWYSQQNQCLNMKQHAVQNIPRLAWGHYARGVPGNCPAKPCVKTALIVFTTIPGHWSEGSLVRRVIGPKDR